MNPRIKLLLKVMSIITLVITGAVVAVSVLSGKSEFYDIVVNLLTAGIVIAALIIPLFYRSHHSARTHIQLHLSVEERNRLVSDPYYDYFAGLAFSPIATAVLGFLLILTANSFGQQTASATTMPFVGSVRPGLKDMQEIAHRHYKDAYLVELEYNFGQSKYYVLSSEFAKFSNPCQRLTISITVDGEYLENFYNLHSSFCSSDPIENEDWTIDSKEAISIFVQDDEIKTCINYPQSREKLLELTRSYSIKDTDVKWCLGVAGCEATQTRTCINAATGEKITQ